MKFVFAFQLGVFGGTEKVSLATIRYLKSRGHECEVVTLQPMENLLPYLQDLGVSWRSFDYKYAFGLPAFSGLVRYFHRVRPDVIVQVGQRPVTTLATAFAPGSFRIYQCLHHHAGVKPSWMWRLNYQLVNRIFDRITFLTRWCAEEAQVFVPSLQAKSSVMYPPISMHAWRDMPMRDAARKKLGLPQDARIVGGLGRLVPVKRFDVFLETAKLIADQDKNYYFVIAGSGPETSKLQQMAADLGIAGKIRWIEWQRDVEDIYASLDVLLFISEWDALGMVPCEAVARGVPAVAAQANGGLFEVLSGLGDCAFNQFNPQMLARAVFSLESPEKVQEIVASARTSISKHCDADSLGEKFLNLIPSKHAA